MSDLKPKIRFKGFTDDWEQRKLGELFNFHYGDGNNNPSNGGKYPVFGAGGIQGGYTKYNAENSVIIGHMGDAGCVSWGEGKHFVTYNGTITKPKDEVFSAKFGYYLLLNMNLRKYRGGSGLPFLTYDMLTEMETKCTNSKIETQKIADYFTHLDHLITLHQRKLDQLKEFKKGCLQKMFPKEGERVPELRFSGFTETWEKHKVGDIVNWSKEKQASAKELKELLDKNGEIAVYSTQEFIGMCNTNIYNNGNALLLPQGGEACIQYVDKPFITANNNIGRVKDNNTQFVSMLLQSQIKEIELNFRGLAIKHPDMKAINNIDIKLPSLPEQQKIASILSEYDTVIELENKRIEKLKLFKKAMLQKMFV